MAHPGRLLAGVRSDRLALLLGIDRHRGKLVCDGLACRGGESGAEDNERLLQRRVAGLGV